MPTNFLKFPLCTALLCLTLGGQTSRVRVGSEPNNIPRLDAQLSSEPLVIVVNRANSVDNISSAELRRIFLGMRSHWPNGRRITLVEREPGGPERNTILHDVCGMTELQMKYHFLHGLYTGEILVSPKTLDSPTGVRKFIFNVPGAIGYLRLEDVDTTVKVLRIDELLPDEKGYRLRLDASPAN